MLKNDVVVVGMVADFRFYSKNFTINQFVN